MGTYIWIIMINVWLKIYNETAFSVPINRQNVHVFFKLLKRICQMYTDKDSKQGK